MSHLFDGLAQAELNFKSRHAAELEPLTYTSGQEELNVLLYKSPHVYHFKETHPKKRIILHFTAGQLNGDLITLTPSEDQPNHFVSVPFVVARDGSIIQLFSSKHWAYNLGMKASNGNVDHIFEKESIAIEISNYGPLVVDHDLLKTPKNKNGLQSIYCATSQSVAFRKLQEPFREYSYFASYPEVQIDSVIRLVRWLCNKYNIPTELVPEAARFDCAPGTQNHFGITSHVNYRSSGKWDLGPVFDWARLEAGIQAPVSVRRAVVKSRGPKRTEENGLKGKVRGARYNKDREEVIE